jgi:hypothetical protein
MISRGRVCHFTLYTSARGAPTPEVLCVVAKPDQQVLEPLSVVRL